MSADESAAAAPAAVISLGCCEGGGGGSFWVTSCLPFFLFFFLRKHSTARPHQLFPLTAAASLNFLRVPVLNALLYSTATRRCLARCGGEN